MKSRNVLYLPVPLLLGLLLFLPTACSDDTTIGTVPENPPEIPEMSPAEVNTSYFDDADTKFRKEYSAFNTARNYAETASSVLNSGFVQGRIYHGMTSASDPEYEDGWWTWIQNLSDDEGDITIRTIAREQNSGVEWAVYLSGTVYDEILDDFLFMEGFYTDNGNSGEWTLYIPDGGTWNYTWTKTPGTGHELSYTLLGDDDREFQINYRQEGAENFMTISGSEYESDALIYWNTETGNGYIERDGDRRCWGENYRQTECE